MSVRIHILVAPKKNEGDASPPLTWCGHVHHTLTGAWACRVAKAWEKKYPEKQGYDILELEPGREG